MKSSSPLSLSAKLSVVSSYSACRSVLVVVVPAVTGGAPCLARLLPSLLLAAQLLRLHF